MADITFQHAFGTTTTFGTLTNLHSLADGNIWNSGAISNTSPVEQIAQISYNLVFNATPVAGDYLAFWLINEDGDATTPYWPGQIGATEGEISAAGSIAEALAAMGQPHHIHAWQTSHGATFRGLFNAWLPKEDWQVCIRAVGEALSASSNVVRYRYITPTTVGL